METQTPAPAVLKRPQTKRSGAPSATPPAKTKPQSSTRKSLSSSRKDVGTMDTDVDHADSMEVTLTHKGEEVKVPTLKSEVHDAMHTSSNGSSHEKKDPNSMDFESTPKPMNFDNNNTASKLENLYPFVSVSHECNTPYPPVT